MQWDIQQYVKTYPNYQQAKMDAQKLAKLLQPLHIHLVIWEEISTDFITSLPKVNVKDTIWIIVDRLTKYAHFIALPRKFIVTKLATKFIVEVCKLHGIPKVIISDRDFFF